MIKNTYEIVIAHRSNVTFIKTGTIAAYFRGVGKYF
jgi:hypothetical protein